VVPRAQLLGQVVQHAFVADKQHPRAQREHHAVDVAVAEPIDAVEPEAIAEVRLHPVQTELVVGGRDVDDHVPPQTQALGPVDHDLEP
jgi:hypothetical protein